MKAIQLLACLLVMLVVACFASETYAQCGRQIVSQQAVQAAPQPAVSVFQLPQQQALVQTQAPITASQSATIGAASAVALPQAQATCANARCSLQPTALASASPQPVSVLQTTVLRPGLLQTLRATRPRPQTVRQRTVVRG